MEKPNRMRQETVLAVVIVAIVIVGSIICSIGYYFKQELDGMRPGPPTMVAVQTVSGNATTGMITVFAHTTISKPGIVHSAIIKDSKKFVKEVVDTTNIDDNDAQTSADVPTIDKQLTKLVIKVETGPMTAGESYSVTLVIQLVNHAYEYSYVSQSFKAEA